MKNALFFEDKEIDQDSADEMLTAGHLIFLRPERQLGRKHEYKKNNDSSKMANRMGRERRKCITNKKKTDPKPESLGKKETWKHRLPPCPVTDWIWMRGKLLHANGPCIAGCLLVLRIH